MLGKFIDHKEDSLTAAVFTHLLHLPSEVFWQILRDACYTDALPANPGEPETVEYWPKWNPAGTGNAVYVEPDVFIRFDSFDLIVEAKRWDDKMQDRDQWRRELIAYANEYGEEKKDVRLLAVGGIHDENDAELTHQWTAAASPDSDAEPGAAHPFTCPVHKCRWRGILDRCRRMLREWEQLSCPSSQTLAVVRVLTDLLDLFAWHGFSTGRWFADFNFARHRLSGDISRHQSLFRQRSQQLTSL